MEVPINQSSQNLPQNSDAQNLSNVLNDQNDKKEAANPGQNGIHTSSQEPGNIGVLPSNQESDNTRNHSSTNEGRSSTSPPKPKIPITEPQIVDQNNN